MLIVVRMSSCSDRVCHVFLCVAVCLAWSVICDQSEQLLLNTTHDFYRTAQNAKDSDYQNDDQQYDDGMVNFEVKAFFSVKIYA